MATLYFSNQNVLVKNLKSRVGSIEGKIPSAASIDNQLADKAYVDTSLSDHISSLTAAFNGSYATYADLSAATGMNKNDYAVVLADESHDNECWRYKYDGAEWKAEYRVNETALTTKQNNALNSGITAETVSNLNSIVPDTATSDNKLATVSDITALSSSTAGNLDSKMDKNNPAGTGSFSFNGGDVGSSSYGLSLGRNSVTSRFDSAVLGGYNGHATADSAVVLGGEDNYAAGTNSLAAGLGNHAVSDHQSVVGRYNLYDDSTNTMPYCFFTVGNGTSDTDRSNAFGISHDGNAYVKGNIYVNCDEKLTNGTSLSDFISQNSALKFTGTLKAGDNRLEFTSSSIEEDMFVNVYASQYGVMPDSVTVEAGRVELRFDEALPANVTFGVRLESFGPNEDGTNVVSSNDVRPSDDPNT